MNVAMAFANRAVGGALLKQGLQTGKAALRPGLQGIDLQQVGLVAEQRADLFEVLPHRRDDGAGVAQRVIGGDPWCVLVEAGNLRGQGVDMGAGQLATGLHGIEQLALGELAHLQGVFQYRATAVELRRRAAAGDRQDLQVQAIGQTLVQAQLFGTEVAACRQLGEVEKAKVDRLFDLVGKGAGEQDPGNMGLDDVEAIYRVRVQGRVLQGGDQCLAHGQSLRFSHSGGRHYGLWRAPCKPC